MKSFFIYSFVILLILGSLFLISYPFISNYLMGLNQSSEIEAYEQEMQSVDDKQFAAAWEEAEAYNESLLGSVVLTDPFDPTAEIVKDYEYESLLNFSSNGVMASLEIPVISLNLPIYHGTSDDVLRKGVGHLQNTSLPVGGEGTHCVLTGHTGLSSASLFTDINLLKVGDKFFIHCLNETLAYEIDQIKVVEPKQTNDLRIDPSQDYITLITCTPYGINSHRLLVRGKRVPYVEGEETLAAEQSRIGESTWMIEYKKALKVGGIVFAVILTVFIAVKIFLKNRKKKIPKPS
ncbi:MAG: class C sortase [Acutalibacteraceae bacterium]